MLRAAASFRATPVAAGSNRKERLRTHLIFNPTQSRSTRKIRRRKGANLQRTAAQHDASVQTHLELDPSQWTGNQRVVHFGPMAYRDPYIYYYPKGWNVLYPAEFGFFPYRTKKFRGSSPVVCLAAFGAFCALAGSATTYLAFCYFHLDASGGSILPIHVIGPAMLAIGASLLAVGTLWWLCSLNLCSEHLRHTQPHHARPRKIVQHRDFEEQGFVCDVTDKSPYLPPPPPPLPVLQNACTDLSLYEPVKEMKLYPPALPGVSTLNISSSSVSYVTPYGTLQRGSNFGDNASMRPEFHKFEVNRTEWVVPVRYTNLVPVGHGAYGCVCSADDSVTDAKVAIKKLMRPFQSVVHAKRAYREVILLCRLEHENLIDLLDLFTSEERLENMSDVYLVSSLMGSDLCSILKIQQLTDEHIQFLVYQVLRGLKYIHSAGVIHRDLKPGNIAVNEDCELRILDFGLARQANDEMTGYVATRWYRAPEIMLNWMHYNQTVDIWSLGCIMAELIIGRPLFPGTDIIDQLGRIIELLGTPGDDLLAKMQSTDARNYVVNLPRSEGKDFAQFFQGASDNAVDLLGRMLLLDPDQRITASDALEHPYLKQFHDADDEPTTEPLDLSFEKFDLPLDEWKRLVWDEIQQFQISANAANGEEPLEQD